MGAKCYFLYEHFDRWILLNKLKVNYSKFMRMMLGF